MGNLPRIQISRNALFLLVGLFSLQSLIAQPCAGTSGAAIENVEWCNYLDQQGVALGVSVSFGFKLLSR